MRHDRRELQDQFDEPPSTGAPHIEPKPSIEKNAYSWSLYLNREANHLVVRVSSWRSQCPRSVRLIVVRIAACLCRLPTGVSPVMNVPFQPSYLVGSRHILLREGEWLISIGIGVRRRMAAPIFVVDPPCTD